MILLSINGMQVATKTEKTVKDLLGKWKNGDPGYNLEIKRSGQKHKFKLKITVPSESTEMKGIAKEERIGMWHMKKRFKYNGDKSE